MQIKQSKNYILENAKPILDQYEIRKFFDIFCLKQIISLIALKLKQLMNGHGLLYLSYSLLLDSAA